MAGLLARTTAFAASLVALCPSTAFAQVVVETDSVELTQGPVIGPAQIVGMGGAIQSLAAGAAAQVFNPAAIANRYEYNPDDYFDWDFAIDGLITRSLLFDIDLENNGLDSTGGDDVAEISVALALNFGRLGLGFNFTAQTYGFSESDRSYTAYVLTPSGGWNFFDGQLVVGGGLELALATVSEDVELLSMSGGGVQFGAIVRPADWPIRFGTTIKSGLLFGDRAVDRTQIPQDIPVVDGIVIPWQISSGVSYTLGPRWRNYKRSFGDAGKQRAAINRPRQYLTLSVDGVLTGPSSNAVGFESWVNNQRQPVGEKATLGIRVGLDSEFWKDQMRARAGYYFEPSRFTAADGRHHVTGGFDFKLFKLIWDWRLTAAVDFAPRYANLMLSFGFWH